MPFHGRNWQERLYNLWTEQHGNIWLHRELRKEPYAPTHGLNTTTRAFV